MVIQLWIIFVRSQYFGISFMDKISYSNGVLITTIPKKWTIEVLYILLFISKIINKLKKIYFIHNCIV